MYTINFIIEILNHNYSEAHRLFNGLFRLRLFNTHENLPRPKLTTCLVYFVKETDLKFLEDFRKRGYTSKPAFILIAWCTTAKAISI